MAVLRQVSDQDPKPIREVNPKIPTWLCAIIGKLHEKDPDDRFQTAKGVADLLGQCLAHVQDPVRFPMPAWQEKRSILGTRFLKPTSRAALLGFMVALVGSIGLWQGWQALAHFAKTKDEVAATWPDPSVNAPDTEEDKATSAELAAAGLNNRVIAEAAFNRLLKEKRKLEAQVAALQANLEKVANQLTTSPTQHGGNPGTGLSVANHMPDRSTPPSGLRLPHKQDIKALAMSPDGSHIAVAEKDDTIHTYVLSRQKGAEFWVAALSQEADPVQKRVRELQQRYESVRKEFPENRVTGIWEDALGKTLQEYLDRMPRVIEQRKRLERLQEQLDAVSTTHDGKGFVELSHRLNRNLKDAGKELDSVQDRLRSELRRGVMRHIQANLSEAMGFDPEQAAAIEALIQTVNAEAQKQRAKPSKLLGDLPERTAEIREEGSFKTKCNSLSCLEYSADGNILIGCGGGSDLFVWNARTGREINRLHCNDSRILKFAVCASSDQVISLNVDAGTSLWATGANDGKKPETKNWLPEMRDVAVSSSGEWLTFLTSAGQIRSGPFEDGNEFSTVWTTSPSQKTKAVAVMPDQRLAASLTGDDTVEIFDGQTGERVRTLHPASTQWTCLAFVPQSNSLVIGGKDGNVYYYDTQTWRQQGHVHVDSSWPISLSVCPNGSLIGVRQANGQASMAPASVQSSSAGLSTYSAVEVGTLFPSWFESP